jgi:hypothetical protein
MSPPIERGPPDVFFIIAVAMVQSAAKGMIT